MPPDFNPMTPDELHDTGPWTVSNDGGAIASDDFTHDVILLVTGDFFSDEQRKAYSENLATKLNAGGVYGWMHNIVVLYSLTEVVGLHLTKTGVAYPLLLPIGGLNSPGQIMEEVV